MEICCDLCVCVCTCVTCSRFLIARQKILYLSALRNGKEGGRVEAATHNQNIYRKISYHGHVIPFMFSMLFVVLSLFLFSFCCSGWDGETIREVKVYACVCCTVNSLNIMNSDVKGLFCDLFRPVDMLTSASLKILCETLPVTTTLLKWILLDTIFLCYLSPLHIQFITLCIPTGHGKLK